MNGETIPAGIRFSRQWAWLSLSAAGVGQTQRARLNSLYPNSVGTEAAEIEAPANACDCHHHIYDAARFAPKASGGLFSPMGASGECRLLQRLESGTTRNVVVTPAPYIGDNRVTLDAIARLGRQCARGCSSAPRGSPMQS